MSAHINLVEAEEWRRSHCDRQEAKHLCVGEVSIKPGMFHLDCKLCGEVTEMSVEEHDLCNAARTIARIFKVDYELLSENVKKQLLIELVAIKRRYRC